MASKSPESDDKTGVPRRKFVAGGAAGWASVAIAGCTGGDGNGNGGTTTEPTDTETEPVTDTETETETETPEPQPENYVVIDEMRTGSEFIPEGTGGFASACAPSRRFAPGMQAVFYIGVYDPDTGDPIGPDNVDSVQINLNIGQTVELAWAEDAGEWHGSWIIPEGTEAQEVTYTVDVATDAETTHVTALESKFSIIDYSAPAESYVVTAQTYHTSTLGDTGSESEFVSSCNPDYTFDPTGQVGFDIGIWHVSGEIVTPDDDVVDSAQVAFPDLDVTLELAWGLEEDVEWMPGEHAWNAVWKEIPDDLSGEYTYEVQISGVDGNEEFNDVAVYRNTIYFI